MPQPNPLDKSHLDQINAALASLQRAKAICARAKRAGIPTEGPDGDCAFLEKQLEQIKQEFFTLRVDDL